IETHEQEITDRLLREIHSFPELSHLHQLPEAELREGYKNLVKNLGYWLAEANELELARKYESLGKRHSDAGVPLHENVRALLLVKEKMLDFISEQGFNPD